MKYRFVVRMLNMRVLSSVAMKEAWPLMWQRMQGPSLEGWFAHACATPSPFHAGRSRQPDHSRMSCRESSAGLGRGGVVVGGGVVGGGVPAGGGVVVGGGVERAASSASSQAPIAATFAGVYTAV